MTIVSTISRYAAAFAAGLLALSGAMLTYEVVARYFFVRPTIWAAELSQLCLIWGCMLAMAYVLRLKRHIVVDAVTELLPRRIRWGCAALSLVLLIVFSLIVVFWGWDIFYESFRRGRTTGSLLNLPVWISELSVPVGFGLLAAQSLVDLIELRLPGRTTSGATPE